MSATDTPTDNAATARRALEVACSGRDQEVIDEVYSETFVDHVNAMEYHGTDGARQSVALYLKLFRILSSWWMSSSPTATESRRVGL